MTQGQRYEHSWTLLNMLVPSDASREPLLTFGTKTPRLLDRGLVNASPTSHCQAIPPENLSLKSPCPLTCCSRGFFQKQGSAAG